MNPTQFVFEGRQKAVFGGLMGIGLLCLGLTFMNDDALHTRFWTNFLHNSVFFTGISFIALFVLCALMTAYSGWQVVIKRIWEAYSMFLVVGIALMAVVVAGVWGNFHHLYHWADVAAVAKDKTLTGKSSFLNRGWYTMATFGFVGVWAFFAYKLRQMSKQEDEGTSSDIELYRKMKKWSAIFMPIGGFTSAAVIWQWIMSIDAHWYSTMFAWYATASYMVSMVSMTVMILIYLKSKGYMPYVTADHLHDLGKLMFGFSVFWTYLWFSQFMLIWYANVGEETIYFRERFDHYKYLFFANLIMNFVLPFFVLIRNDVKRKSGSMFFMAALIFFGHWVDFFLMIKPGAFKNAQEHHAMPHEANDAHTSTTKVIGTATFTAAQEPAKAVEHAAGAVHEATKGAIETTHEAVKAGVEATHEAAKGAVEGAHEVAKEGAEAVHGTTEAVHTAGEAAAHEGHEAHGEHGSAELSRTGFQYPMLLEVGTMLGFLGLFLYVVFASLAKASLLPKNDPYVEESLNHHV